MLALFVATMMLLIFNHNILYWDRIPVGLFEMVDNFLRGLRSLFCSKDQLRDFSFHLKCVFKEKGHLREVRGQPHAKNMPRKLGSVWFN